MKGRALVTGGAGFIGSHAVRRLLNEGMEAVVFDDCSRPGSALTFQSLAESGARCVAGDVSRRDEIDALFLAQGPFDLILHQAGQVAVTRSLQDPLRDFEVNAGGTLHLLLAALRQAREGLVPVFLYPSTNKVYGSLSGIALKEEETRWRFENLPQGIDENSPLSFEVPYACSKGAADRYVTFFSKQHHLPTVVFRQSCIYGSEQYGLEEQGWLAWLAIAAVLEKPITLFGDGKQMRDVLWIDDLIDLYLLAYSNIGRVAGEVFNVGGGPRHTLSLRELLSLLASKLGRAPTFSRGPERAGDQAVYVSDNSRVEKALSWEPRVSPEEGVSRLLNWVEENTKKIG